MKQNRKNEPNYMQMYRKQILKPAEKKRITEQKGRTEASQAGFYNKQSWIKIRDRRRIENPLCQMCEERGYLNPMKVVDHVIAIDVAPELALSYDNTQSLCDFCHNLKTAQDKRAKAKAKRLAIGRKLMEELEKKHKG